jgi:chromate transporter
MLKVGCIGFGGGSALIPVLQREAVEDKHLITEEELDSDVVAASITPGALPVEMAAGIGKKVGGIWGMFAGASAMAFPGSFLVMVFLIFTSVIGPVITNQLNYASIGVTTYIILVLLEYILTTMKKAKNNHGGMIQAAIVILAVWMFNGEQKVFNLFGIQETPIFGVSTVEIFIIAFFVIVCTGGHFKSIWFLISGGISLVFLLVHGKSHVIDMPYIDTIVIVVMIALVLIRSIMNFRTKERFEAGQLKGIMIEIALWIVFLAVLCIPALLVSRRSIYFIGEGLLSALMSFGGGDAYLSVAHGLFVDSNMIQTGEFYGSVVTIANILPGSILCKVLSGIGYVWGYNQTGTILGGVCVALAGFACATAASCAVFGVVKILYDKWKQMEMFQALSDLIRPIVSGLLISVGISLYNTNCIIETQAGWGWGSVLFLMIVVAGMVRFQQKKRIHMIFQVVSAIAVSLLACNLFNLGI